jgi:hypothetical protein
MHFEFILSVAKDLALVACYVYIISNAIRTTMNPEWQDLSSKWDDPLAWE